MHIGSVGDAHPVNMQFDASRFALSRSRYVKVVLLRHRLFPASAILFSVFCVAFVDVMTGSETRLYPLYFIPITIAGSRLGKLEAMVVAQFCTAAWLIANLFDGTYFSSTWYWVINTLAQWCAFSFVAYLISKLHAVTIKVEEEARVDPLTELPNIRGFNEHAIRLLDLCHRERAPLVIAYIDLDNFKHVNDIQGHKRGNDVLRIAAQTMKSTFRSADLLGRVGGDEFIVMLPHAASDRAAETLERARLAIEVAMLSENCEVTASLGAVAYDSAPRDFGLIIETADKVLLQAKQMGKNRVVMISNPSPS